MLLRSRENVYCAGGGLSLKMELSHDSFMKYRQMLLNALIRHFTQFWSVLQSEPQQWKFWA